MEGLTLQDYTSHCNHNETVAKEMLQLAKNYNKVEMGVLVVIAVVVFVVLVVVVVVIVVVIVLG